MTLWNEDEETPETEKKEILPSDNEPEEEETEENLEDACRN